MSYTLEHLENLESLKIDFSFSIMKSSDLILLLKFIKKFIKLERISISFDLELLNDEVYGSIIETLHTLPFLKSSIKKSFLFPCQNTFTDNNRLD